VRFAERTRLVVPEGIALDTVNGKMYWADQGPSKISRANLDGTDVEILVTSGTTHPHDIGLDFAGGKMYWTDSYTNNIQRAHLEKSCVPFSSPKVPPRPS